MKEIKDDFKHVFTFHINVNDLLPATEEEKKQQAMMKEGSTFLKDGLKRLYKNKVAMTCVFIIAFIILTIIFVPMFWPYTYDQQLGITQGESVDASYSNLRMFQFGSTELIKKAKYENGLNKTTGPNGTVEYQVTETAIQWKYKNSSDWKDLITLEELAEANGYKSSKGTLGIDLGTEYENYVSWAYATSNAKWSDLVSKEKLDSHLIDLYNQEAVLKFSYNADNGALECESVSENKVYTIASTNDLPKDYIKNIENSTSLEYSFVEGKLVYREYISQAYNKLFKITKIGSIVGENPFPHIFGTDSAGRDYFIRVVYGARISLSVGLFASLIVLVIGTIYGSVSGYFGGKTDLIMMRIVDIIYALPDTLIIILLSVVLKATLADAIDNSFLASIGSNMISIFIVFGLLYWVSMARLIRGQILSLKEQEYVLAAKSVGAKPSWIIKKHLLPNCISVIIISTALQIPSAIFTESFLSFLGIGISAPMPSLGSLASDALSGVFTYTYRLVIPSVTICLIVLSLNLLGDGLRDAFDPKIRN